MGGCEIEEGHLMEDRVHRLVPIPPKHSIALVVGCIKKKRQSIFWDRHGQATELCRTELLDARIFFFDKKARRSYGWGIHKKAGGGSGWIGWQMLQSTFASLGGSQ